MTDLKDYGGLLMGSRLRRLSEALYAGVDEIYREHGVQLSSRCFPILFLLRDNGPLSITDLAGRLGQSHPALSQMSRKLLAEGVVVERADPADERRRLLDLSRKGQALMVRLGPVWKAVEGAVEELADADLGPAIRGAEEALEARPFAGRIRDRFQRNLAAAVEVIRFEPRYRDDFKRLNVEWLEKYFYVEAIDHEVLSQPERMILQPGGHIFLARLGGEIVGTGALIRTKDGFELSKMAVTERYQGLRIGQRLLLAAIEAFQKSGTKTLFLESNSKLKTAIRLYELNGFEHAPRPEPSHYQRADVYMVYRPARKPRRA
ncbi:MAG TPA: bifunctional helix-turn-helix transcriptional regulator/GNAT family N-acetyltransferase [Geothrix sp.]|nr:bifunctional helix-turn-helix transcriptional regulator/GNAT family N-acetyltransferase [Geothrix sp.]